MAFLGRGCIALGFRELREQEIPKPREGTMDTPPELALSVPSRLLRARIQAPGTVASSVPDAKIGTRGTMGTANPKYQNHLAAANPPNPLYPPLFSEDGEAPTFSRSRQRCRVHERTLASLARTLWAAVAAGAT
jgi:hypothetical protein